MSFRDTVTELAEKEYERIVTLPKSEMYDAISDIIITGMQMTINAAFAVSDPVDVIDSVAKRLKSEAKRLEKERKSNE